MSEEEEKLISEMLTKEMDSIKATMDASTEMMCFTKNKSVVYVNTHFLSFTGRLLSDELGLGRFDIIHPDDIHRVQAVLDSFYQKQKPYRVKYRSRNSENSYKWIVEDGRAFFSPNGTSLGFVSKCVDIDKEKKIEIKLHAAETKYRRLFETAYDGVILLDSITGEITDVNPFLIALLGYSKEEFIGKKLWEVSAFKNIKASKEAFKILQEEGYVRYEDLPLETKDGRLIPVEFVSNAYTAGSVRVMQCNIRDITERKRGEMMDKALSTLKQEKQKNSFIADVTHELRTPLAIIKGNVELALRAKHVTNKKTFQAINLEVNHLAKMILDLAVLTTDSQDEQRKVTLEKVDLSALLYDVVRRLEIVSAKKEIDIVVDIPLSCLVLGDDNYLEKLFSNIISNAINYGKEHGTIHVTGRVENNQAVIMVTDNGIGMSEEELPNIFERFYRSVHAREVNQGGTGLGLAMSKWIVDAHGGTISVTSKLHTGTTFTISLPLFS